MIEAFPLDESFSDTDWSDPKAVQTAWRRFFEAFTRHVKKQAQTLQG